MSGPLDDPRRSSAVSQLWAAFAGLALSAAVTAFGAFYHVGAQDQKIDDLSRQVSDLRIHGSDELRELKAITGINTARLDKFEQHDDADGKMMRDILGRLGGIDQNLLLLNRQMERLSAAGFGPSPHVGK